MNEDLEESSRQWIVILDWFLGVRTPMKRLRVWISRIPKFCRWQNQIGNAKDFGRGREQPFSDPNLVLITKITFLHSQLCLFAMCFTLDSNPFSLFPYNLTLILIDHMLTVPCVPRVLSWANRPGSRGSNVKHSTCSPTFASRLSHTQDHVTTLEWWNINGWDMCHFWA